MCIPTSSAVTGVPFPVLRQSLLEQTTLSNLATLSPKDLVCLQKPGPDIILMWKGLDYEV